MASKGHDNGAVNASDRKTKKKKLDVILQELANEKASRIKMSKQLEVANETIRALQTSLTAPRSESLHSSDFVRDNGPTSTPQHCNDVEAETNRVGFPVNLDPVSTPLQGNSMGMEMSRFMSSMNQMSVTSINVPECKPAFAGEQIGRRDYESWIDLLSDTLKLAGVQDERTRFIVFKVKAGPVLLEIFKNTKSSAEAPNEVTLPFSNALFRMKTYFGSASDAMLQRRKLALIIQRSEETDLAFVMRVGSTARLCDFQEGKEFDEIVNAVAGHASNKDVRAAALKMVNRPGTFTDLVDVVREIEAVAMNEEYYRLKHGKPEPAKVAAVGNPYPKAGPSRRGVYRHPASTRGRLGHPYAGPFRTGSRLPPDQRRFGNSQGNESYSCYRCNGTDHHADGCFAIDTTCFKCGRKGHLKRACRPPIKKENHRRSEGVNPDNTVGKIASIDLNPVAEADENAAEDGLHIATLLMPKTSTDDGIITAKVAGLECEFLIDSGAQVNTLTHDRFDLLRNDRRYRKELFNIQYSTDRPLKAYATEGEIPVTFTFEAFLHISDDRPSLLEKFYVVKECRSLLGRSTATRYSVLLLGLQVPVNSVKSSTHSWYDPREIASVTMDEVFPKFNIPPIQLSYDQTRPPCRNVFMNIPIAVKPMVEKRLHQLLAANIIERVTHEMEDTFCSSMLAIPKGKDDIRLVIDLRGPNSYIQRSPFAMPCLEKILAELDGAQWFSTIDMSNAFFHIELHENSRHLTNFCTEFGMYRCVRLPFGLCNAPDIFQEVLQRKILAGCKGVKNYLDDILIFGKTQEEHDENLNTVMACLQEHNVKINASKCVFKSQSVRFLGFRLTANGWQIEEEKMSAIRDFRRPETVAEVKSFLGLVTFVDKFVPHRATKTEKLRMLANSIKFYWSEEEEREFQTFKCEALEAIKTLGYFNTADKTELFVDASAIGLGAVLVQFNDNGIPRIIACASKALTATEQRYPQTHREALAVVWGVNRFAYYLSGRTFIIRTDAEANQFIFGREHRIGKRAVSRAEAWALRLQPFDFTIERVPGKDNVADVLSRLMKMSQDAEPFEDSADEHVLFALDTGNMDISLGEIEVAAELDEELIQLCKALKNDEWPRELRRYEAQKKHLHYLGTLVCKDDKIVLPNSLRSKAMESAHGGHVGEVAMKRIMREFFWWPRMAAETERFVKDCQTCCMLSKKNRPLPISSRNLPEGPWEIIQTDFLSIPGYGTGDFLTVVDTYSRYLSVVEMRGKTAEATNAALCDIFKLWGCPYILQSDNGPPFNSSTYCSFWENKGVHIRKSIPLCPQTNGLVERQNQSIIKAVSASTLDGTNWRMSLDKFVHNHNTLIPHARLMVTPFELMVGYKYRGTFPTLWTESRSKGLDRDNIKELDAEAKLYSKHYADQSRGAKESYIKVGDVVLMSQQRKHKSDPTFSSERFTVITRTGAKVVIMSSNGVQYARNVQDVKLAPPAKELNFSEDSGEDSVHQHADRSGLAIILDEDSEKQLTDDYLEQHQVQSSKNTLQPNQHIPNKTTLRHHSNVRRPARFNDYFIYHIYQ
ncbi:uncharacterized protein K02A2.6-like [Toxorhynchites rutilus septentrionalis]|uniref:uncharacterized protein K02A2.6-like n=1 Tax=Toxorhynchites rutilus septentrionalis TaxID=329112 RepID=UPI00247A3F3D|nr:uncharacterized protein K02A2.6-like [Toxorhynchites rutilus septentrionalis]